MEMTGAEALCRVLEELGVEVAFGHPGGAILPIYDALHRAGTPRHVLMRHEQAAAHAADGYARATGRVGVCMATSGPGATNLVTGLATAAMDGVPIVAITGQVPTGARGTDAFQETDILGITAPVTKHGFLVEDADELEETVREAFRIAASGRPGPVLVDIPKDVQNAHVRARASARAGSGDGGEAGFAVGRPDGASTAFDSRALERAAVLLNGARRPVLMVGRGVVCAGVSDALVELAERAELPVITTLLGLDGFPLDHPFALGMPGMHGTERANRAIQEADVIVGLGLRFDDRVVGRVDRFAPRAAIVHADIRPASVGRLVEPEVELIGDLRETLPALAARVRAARRPEWWATLRGWAREAEPARPWAQATGPLTARVAARALAARIGAAGATVATDVGQHQMLIAQELGAAAPGTHLTSGGLGTMGYALPAALGAAFGRPGHPTWVVAGDGGFQMNLQELATVVQERVPLRIAVINNGFLGMVRQWQELFYERRYSASDISGPNLVLLAEAYGIPARAVDQAADLEAALDWADGEAGPVILDLRVIREENVYPMVAPGAGIDEMIGAAQESVA